MYFQIFVEVCMLEMGRNYGETQKWGWNYEVLSDIRIILSRERRLML